MARDVVLALGGKGTGRHAARPLTEGPTFVELLEPIVPDPTFPGFTLPVLPPLALPPLAGDLR